MKLVKQHQNKAAAFDAANPRVYRLFKKYALEAKKSGQEQYSAAAIFEIIRWQETVKTTGGNFKLSNNHKAYYARKLMETDKRFANFFRVRGN